MILFLFFLGSDLVERTYRIILSDISLERSSQSDWLHWTRGAKNARVSINIVTPGLIPKLQPVLMSAASFFD